MAAAVVVLASCGDDDGGDAGGVQGEAAQQAIDRGKEAGLELEESCVQDLAKQLSDDDAQAIVDEGADGDPTLSDEGEALTDSLLDCVDKDALIDFFIDDITQSVDNIDTDCLRTKLEALDLSTALEADDPPHELVSAVTDCTTS